MFIRIFNLYRNPRYEQPRVRASTISAGISRPIRGSSSDAGDSPSPGGHTSRPLPKPRRAMSVSCKDKRPHPLPRLPSQTEVEEDHLAEVESTYSTPYTANATTVLSTPNRRNLAKPNRSRVSSVSSTSSLSSTSSSLPSSPSSSPSSPQLQQSLSPEQFWAKYRRGAAVGESKKFRSLFSSLSLSDAAASSSMLAESAATAESEEPVYSEIYGAVARPPLPRKNSVSKPPARPPLPADKQRVQPGRSAVVSREVSIKEKETARQ
jgi:hypothetical protein